MGFECSECGNILQCDQVPLICPHCGLVGVFFHEQSLEESDAPQKFTGMWFDVPVASKPSSFKTVEE